jgi:hypothetical protein
MYKRISLQKKVGYSTVSHPVAGKQLLLWDAPLYSTDVSTSVPDFAHVASDIV